MARRILRRIFSFVRSVCSFQTLAPIMASIAHLCGVICPRVRKYDPSLPKTKEQVDLDYTDFSRAVPMIDYEINLGSRIGWAEACSTITEVISWTDNLLDVRSVKHVDIEMTQKICKVIYGIASAMKLSPANCEDPVKIDDDMARHIVYLLEELWLCLCSFCEHGADLLKKGSLPNEARFFGETIQRSSYVFSNLLRSIENNLENSSSDLLAEELNRVFQEIENGEIWSRVDVEGSLC